MDTCWPAAALMERFACGRGRRQQPAAYIEILSLQTSWVTSPAARLAFAPDGRTLACGTWDRTVKLWEVPSGRLLHTLPGQTDQAR